MFVLDCNLEYWSEVSPSGAMPPSRRGHSFSYFKTDNSAIISNLAYAVDKKDVGNGNGNVGKMREFFIMYGGSGVDPAKEFERVFYFQIFLIITHQIHRNPIRCLMTCGSSILPTIPGGW